MSGRGRGRGGSGGRGGRKGSWRKKKSISNYRKGNVGRGRGRGARSHSGRGRRAAVGKPQPQNPGNNLSRFVYEGDDEGDQGGDSSDEGIQAYTKRMFAGALYVSDKKKASEQLGALKGEFKRVPIEAGGVGTADSPYIITRDSLAQSLYALLTHSSESLRLAPGY